MRKGYILLTTLAITFAILFLGIIQLTYSTLSARRVENYYQNMQRLYQQESSKSAQAYQELLESQP